MNGQYTGNDSLGNLIHDFKQKDWRKCKTKIVKEVLRHYKEGDEYNMFDKKLEAYGKIREQQAIRQEKKYAEENRLNTLIKTVTNAVKGFQCTVQEAMNILDVSEADQAYVLKNIKL